ncbi:MAG: hypothetical protein COT90_04425 [Candidatus Diapherotrites archaeon CG10_big_fil_rev_8_21_14_0_10_31_34]|nr:MAG: hypothetical protein COT90_04425 [Candidatus Diapherotrites archaeon CG10_big_fil_rev_8_21_14_0_10_31_34]
MNGFEEVLTELKRKGDSEKVKYLEGLDKRITPSQKKRIQENDSGILQELFAPKWVSRELLYAWATKNSQKETCVLCAKQDELGMHVKGKFICSNCFIEIKHKK